MQPRARKRVAYDTDTSASCEEKQSRRDKRYYYGWQDNVLAAVDGAWHIATLCHRLVCGVHVLDGTEENAQTEARDARCLHASELKQSIFSHHFQGDAHRAGSKRPGSQTVTIKPVSRRSTPLTFFRYFCLNDRNRADIRLFKRNKNSIAVGQWARPPALSLCFDKQATAPSDPSLHPCCRQHVQKREKPEQLRSSAPSTPAWLSMCAVSSKLLTQSAPSPLSSSDRNEALPSKRFNKRQLEKKRLSCEMCLASHRRRSAT